MTTNKTVQTLVSKSECRDCDWKRTSHDAGSAAGWGARHAQSSGHEVKALTIVESTYHRIAGREVTS